MKFKPINLLVIFTITLCLLNSAFNATIAYALSDTPLINMPTTNGTVYSIAPDGTGGVYIGGYFTQITPANGGGDIARNNIAHINANGSVDPTWNPNSNDIVLTLTVNGNTVYAGGGFTNIGGQNRNRIAALDTITGNATTWNPSANNYVNTIAVSGSTVYVGGGFTTIDGQNRSRIAALDATTGSATAWNPNANNYVNILIVSGSQLYVGGEFTNIGGQNRNNLAALDTITGNATAWNPNANSYVYDLVMSGNTLYVGGGFTIIDGLSRNRIAALDVTTGSVTAWDPNANGDVYVLKVYGSTVYAGGGFTNISGQNRNNLAALDTTTGNATAWNPNANSYVVDLVVSGNALYTGGWFTTVSGQSHTYFASFSLDTTVFSHTLQSSYTGMGPSSFTVTFSEDVNNPAGDSNTDDVTNPNNYKIINKGANGTVDTVSCASAVGGDDTLVIPNSVTYLPNTSIVNIGSTLPNGSYQLFVCGTTSIVDLAGNPLNGGTDFTFDFTVGPMAASTRIGNKTTSASSLPATGFAPKTITTLPPQPANLEYAKLGDLVLEIPSLNVKSTIVGVPQSADKTWDVTWLGNNTGWLNGTAFPTWNGNSVLTAHVTNASGVDGPFAALKSLKYGDQVIVHVGGVKYVYEVRETKLIRPYSTSYAFESKQDASYLTLITCSMYNPLNETYLFRRVVRAVLISMVNE